jgi:hypothetical protein
VDWNQGKFLGFEAEAREAHCYCHLKLGYKFLARVTIITFNFAQNKLI